MWFSSKWAADVVIYYNKIRHWFLADSSKLDKTSAPFLTNQETFWYYVISPAVISPTDISPFIAIKTTLT